MKIESVHVENYRSILNETLQCENLTALVGSNGSGKSSFLRSLDLFFSFTPKIYADDFYNCDSEKEIKIIVTFSDLSSDAQGLFSPYLQSDKLSVELRVKWADDRTTFSYHGSRLQNPDFYDFWSIDNAKDKKIFYDKLRSDKKYSTLPAWKNQTEAPENLKKWESENIDKCEMMSDDGKFFGFKGVGQGYIKKYIQFLFIQAVRDASDDGDDKKSSTFTILMDLVVRSVLARKSSVSNLKSETQEKYNELFKPENLPELGNLSERMTETLKTFVPDAGVKLEWLPLSEINIPMPQAEIKLVEDGYSSKIEKTGHGLQRAFILTMLQHLASAQAQSPKDESIPATEELKLPNLVLAIEEPELYQHPNRQRHLAKILLQLSNGKTPGVAENTQIIYCTHSPHFVGIDRIDQIRLLKKIPVDVGNPKVTKIVSTKLEEVANDIWEADGKPGQKYSKETLLPRLQAIMTPWMNEGFFADVVVLVEGEDDRSAILGVAKSKDYELEGNGFSVIPCGGKSNIDRPFIIFKRLGLSMFLIWDGDFGKGETSGKCEKCSRPLDAKANPKENSRLLKLLECEEKDWPDCVDKKYACFKCNLETTLREEIGDSIFDKYLEECQNEFGISKQSHAKKNPSVISEILKRAKKDGHSSKTLDDIFDKILALKGLSAVDNSG